MAKLPAFQFYPGDWLKDPPLRACSPGARALWIDLLCLMFESPVRGVLIFSDGTPWSDEQIARAIPGQPTGNLEALHELLRNGVARRNGAGAIFNARMVRDEHDRQQWRVQKQQQRVHPLVHPNVRAMSALSSSSSSSSNHKNPPAKPAGAPPTSSEAEQRRKIEARDYRLGKENEARREAAVGTGPVSRGSDTNPLRHKIMDLAKSKEMPEVWTMSDSDFDRNKREQLKALRQSQLPRSKWEQEALDAKRRSSHDRPT